MLTDFLISGRPAGPSSVRAPDNGPRAATILARITRLDRLGRRSAPAAADTPQAPGASSGSPSGSPSNALSAASEAERLKRLRASFEDDLAHFLRTASSPTAE